MIRRFCDCCGDEIIEGENNLMEGADRIKVQVKGINNTILGVEFLTSLDGVYNEGDFCRYCVIDAVDALDDRTEPGGERTQLTKEEAGILLQSLYKFIWCAFTWNDHNFSEQDLYNKLRSAGELLGLSSDSTSINDSPIIKKLNDFYNK